MNAILHFHAGHDTNKEETICAAAMSDWPDLRYTCHTRDRVRTRLEFDPAASPWKADLRPTERADPQIACSPVRLAACCEAPCVCSACLPETRH